MCLIALKCAHVVKLTPPLSCYYFFVTMITNSVWPLTLPQFNELVPLPN